MIAVLEFSVRVALSIKLFLLMFAQLATIVMDGLQSHVQQELMALTQVKTTLQIVSHAQLENTAKLLRLNLSKVIVKKDSIVQLELILQGQLLSVLSENSAQQDLLLLKLA